MASREQHLCENCGNPAPLELPFCGSCGHANNPDASIPPVPAQSPAENGHGLEQIFEPVPGAVAAGQSVAQSPTSTDAMAATAGLASYATTPGTTLPPSPPPVAPSVRVDTVTHTAAASSAPPAAAPPANGSPAERPSGDPSPAKRSRTPLVLAVVVVLLVVAAVSIALVSGGSNTGGKASSTTTSAPAPARSASPGSGSRPSHAVVVAGSSSSPWATQTIPSNTANYLYDISCPNSKTCLAVGKTGSCPQGVMCNSGGSAVILATTDGGQTWEPQQYPTNSTLFSDGYLFSVSCG